MILHWIDWLFDERLWRARLAVLLALAVGYLLVLTDPQAPPSRVDWVFALVAVATCVRAGRWPLGSTLIQAGLLAAAFRFGDTGPMVGKVAAGVAMFDLAARGRGWRLVLGVAALVGAYMTHPGGEIPALLYRAVTVVGLSTLVGLHVRSVRDLSAQAQRGAEAERLRRVSETRAARADERTAIARELHDLVAHHVASMVLRVSAARHVLRPVDPRVGAVLDDVHATGTSALTDLRGLVAVLRAPESVADVALADPAELPAALRDVADRARQLGLEVELTVDPAIGALDAVRGLAVLRLAQEGLANVAQHAGPRATARVTVRAAAHGTAAVEIVDSGPPGSPSPGSAERDGAGRGHGLVGMRERVALLGGTFAAGAHGRGWRLAASLPPVAEVAL
ncbi:sensor histidine kinase [Longispora fulva]|uniref:histidine kinase n=1 Tax=Longispora fulva TaxID=619741 RepID=A0A8J7KG26_9ACTN|nr:histidine kinase [Longispora fulva]MBG6134479.1 signal transduction histidine kinase [Longispora fulva]